MSSYNLIRGEELFFRELEKLSKKYHQIAPEIMILGAYFSGKVGVMQENAVDHIEFFDEETFSFQLNGVPAFRKLSLSVLTSLIYHKEKPMLDQLKMVINIYNDGSYKKFDDSEKLSKTKDEKEYIDEVEELESILKSSQNIQTQYLFEQDESGKLVTKSLDVDSIDLLDEFDDDEKSIEGLRSSGKIDISFDTMENSNYEIKSKSSSIYGKVVVNSDNEIEIICPYTNSKEVYQIDSTTYASFETDQPFKIKFNLNDLNPQSSSSMSEITPNAG